MFDETIKLAVIICVGAFLRKFVNVLGCLWATVYIVVADDDSCFICPEQVKLFQNIPEDYEVGIVSVIRNVASDNQVFGAVIECMTYQFYSI